MVIISAGVCCLGLVSGYITRLLLALARVIRWQLISSVRSRAGNEPLRSLGLLLVESGYYSFHI